MCRNLSARSCQSSPPSNLRDNPWGNRNELGGYSSAANRSRTETGARLWCYRSRCDRGAGLYELAAVLPVLSCGLRLLDGLRHGLPGNPSAAPHDRRPLGPADSPDPGSRDADDTRDDDSVCPAAVRHVAAVSLDAAGLAPG